MDHSLVELGYRQVRPRMRLQVEALVSLYRVRAGRPADSSCQPPTLLLGLIWVVSIMPVVTEYNCRWLTTGFAGVKLRPVDLGRDRWYQVRFVGALVATVVIVLGVAVAFESSSRQLGLMLIPSMLVVGGAFGFPVSTNRRAKRFDHKIDVYSGDLCRYRGSPAGSGRELLGLLHDLVDAEGLVIGGDANSIELRDRFYLRNGRVLDRDAGTCLRVVRTPPSDVYE